jgi:hypothetical protein
MQRIAIVLVAVVLAACGSDAGAEDATSGIRGRASAGPQCPVEVEGSPCPDLPWQGTVIATDADSGATSTVTTDAEGRFEFALDPGTYEVTIAPGSSPPSAEAQTVVVEADSFTEIVIAVDTGIR